MEYTAIIAHMREVIRAAVPRGATILVASKGDDAMLDLGPDIRAWHFPRTIDGNYSGSYPTDSDEAIAHLRIAHAQGGQFLAFPQTAFWWLDHYDGLHQFLTATCPPPVGDEAVRIYDLRPIRVAAEGISWEQTAAAMQRFAFDPEHAADIEKLIARLIRLRLATDDAGRTFRVFQQLGLHVLPVHFYSPVPDTRELPDSLWSSTATDLPAIDFNDAVQLDLIQNAFPRFRGEYESLPHQPPPDRPDEFHLDNEYFGGRDALTYYCMIRRFRPRRIIEVGSGYSSLIAARAALANGDDATNLTCIEPFPSPALQRRFPGLSKLIAQPVQQVPLAEFDGLAAGDFLFIDSTHVVKTASDVNYLFLEVLPRLRPGVIVHVHDIFLPGEYPRDWIQREHIFWNEQYLLRAFLMFNQNFEILLANAYLSGKYPDVVRATFPTVDPRNGASFWMRRVR